MASETSRSGVKVISLDTRQTLAGIMCVLDLLGLCSQEGDIWLDGILHICQLHQGSKCKSQHVRTLCGFVTPSWEFGVHKPMNGLQRNTVIVFSSVTDTAVTPEWLTIFKGELPILHTQALWKRKRQALLSTKKLEMYVKIWLAPDLKTPDFYGQIQPSMGVSSSVYESMQKRHWF